MAHDERIFFGLVIHHFVNQLTLDLANLLTEEATRYDTLGFMPLAKWMMKHVKKASEPLLSAHLAPLLSVPGHSSAVLKARQLRDWFIAHQDADKLTMAIGGLSKSDMEELLSESQRLLAAVTIGRAFSLIYPEYMTWADGLRSERQPMDIERFLVSIAKASDLLNYPESQPLLWEARQRAETDIDKELFNEWRVKVGLPRVSFES
jgi:hypothetical protein